MSESKAPARPSQVTVAAWAAAIGSALLVLTLFDSISQIRSVEMRESIDDFLATAPGSGLGLDASQILGILRGTMLFAGACAAAAAVLAIYVLQRNQGARIGYTIAAAAIMFTAPVTGSPFAVIVAAAAMMFWTRPARDWFAGRAPAPARKQQQGGVVSSEDQPPANPRAEGADPAEWPRMPDSSTDRPVPPPTEGFGNPAEPVPSQQPGAQQGWQQGSQPGSQQGSQPGSQPGAPQPSAYGQGRQAPMQHGQVPPSPSWPPPAYGQQPQQYAGYPAYAQPRNPDARPLTVTIAAWLTWGFSAVTAAIFALVVFVLVAANDQFIDQIRSEPEFQQLDLAADDVLAALWVVCAIVLFWCVASFVLAVFAFRGANWARIALVVSAGMAAVFSLVAITSFVSFLNLVAAVATIVLLFTGGANQWYSRRRAGYPPYPQHYGQQPGQQYGQQPGEQYPGAPQGQPGQAPYGQQPDPGAQQYGGQPESGDKQDPPKNVW